MTTRQLLGMISALGCASIVAVSAMSAPAVAAGPPCVERKALVKGLSTKYQEHRQGLGITSANTGALEFYASDRGTWTITVTTTNGQTCIIASGHSWHTTPRLVSDPGA